MSPARADAAAPQHTWRYAVASDSAFSSRHATLVSLDDGDDRDPASQIVNEALRRRGA